MSELVLTRERLIGGRESPLYPVDSSEAASLVQEDAFGLEFVVATALTISKEESLRRRFQFAAGLPTDARFQITGLVPNCWLLFDADDEVTANRIATRGVFSVDFQEALAVDGRLSQSINETMDRNGARADARDILKPLIEPDPPTREAIERQARWAPLLELLAYRYTARIVGFLNSVRPSILSDPDRGGSENLLRYWTGAQIVGRAMLFASEPEAEPWLADLANHMTWSPWSPTYPLIRERSLWLACCAARSAAAFGPSVVENYLQSLGRAKNLLATFDSLFGLVAIGLKHRQVAKAIVSELELIRITREHSDYVDKALKEAIRHLRGGAQPQIRNVVMRQLGWLQKGRARGFFSRQSLCADPVIIINGVFPGFEIIPIVVSEPQTAFFPSSKDKSADVTLAAPEIEKVFWTAWGATREFSLSCH